VGKVPNPGVLEHGYEVPVDVLVAAVKSRVRL